MGMKYVLKQSYYTRKGCNRLNLRREWKKIKLGTLKPISATPHSSLDCSWITQAES